MKKTKRTVIKVVAAIWLTAVAATFQAGCTSAMWEKQGVYYEQFAGLRGASHPSGKTAELLIEYDCKKQYRKWRLNPKEPVIEERELIIGLSDERFVYNCWHEERYHPETTNRVSAASSIPSSEIPCFSMYSHNIPFMPESECVFFGEHLAYWYYPPEHLMRVNFTRTNLRDTKGRISCVLLTPVTVALDIVLLPYHLFEALVGGMSHE